MRKGLRKLSAYLPVCEELDTARLEREVLLVVQAIEEGTEISSYPSIHVH